MDLTSLLPEGYKLAVRDVESNEIRYTTDGKFLKHSGYFYQGHARLQGFRLDEAGLSNACHLKDLKAAPAKLLAKASSYVNMLLNLNSNSEIITEKFRAWDERTYNAYYELSKVFDRSGIPHLLSVFFRHQSANTWEVIIYIDNRENISQVSGMLSFSADGLLREQKNLNHIKYHDSDYEIEEFNLDFSGSTQYGMADQLYKKSTDGHDLTYAVEEIVDANNVIKTLYTNGMMFKSGKIAIYD